MAGLQQDGGGASLAPDDPIAARIAAVWGEVLGLEALDHDTDFFELGGDSLAAVSMLAAVEERTGVPVDFVDFLEGPTVAALAIAVARGQEDPQQAPAPAREDAPAAHARLSFAQERLWFLEQLGGSTAAYNMPIGARLHGGLDADAMQRALRDLLSRHEALRTTFTTEHGQAVAVSAADGDVMLELLDLRGSEVPEQEAQRFIAELASRSFDLERGPLMRAALVRLAEEEHVLELVFHHIICDGCSQAVLMSELGALYDAHCRGEQPLLGAPPAQYEQFARTQRAALEAQGMDELTAPWLECLAGAPEALELASDRPHPAVPSYRGATYRMPLATDTVAAVRRFSKATKATPFMTLLAAYFLLLHRHGAEQDIVIGATTAGRETPELAGSVGLLANTVALRGDLSGDPGFAELVARVRETVLWAIAHQQVPLQEIVARLPLERDLSRHPLFQAFCAHVPLASLGLKEAEPYDAAPTTSRFDLTLFIEEEPDGGLELAWEYSSDLFDAQTIERMSYRYVRLLEAALAEPRRSIEELSLLDPAEREQAIVAGHQSSRDYPVQCMHEAFERCAAEAPQAVAVSFEDRSLTYAELNERANRVAHRLIALGAAPETLVALFLEPSLELAVAILGVLKAGAGYLPLDPEHPQERLDFVIADAGAGLVVTEARLLERLGDIEVTSICLDRDAAELEALSGANPATAVTEENLAYVIYTSGSTGRPKGVQVEHRQIARLFSATEEWFGFGPSDVWVLLHSYAFDFSVWEFWGALAHGGQLVISPVWTTRSPQALAELLAARGVTVLNATPSLFTAVQDELLRHTGELKLRFVVFGGEALRPSALRPWFGRHGENGPMLVNMYGITETTVHVTYRPLSAADCEREASPVGVPIPDLSVYVLDGKGAPLPAGVAGELYVGGAGVARGYLNRAELTRERFVENPFGSGRLYRTGDVAARRADGELEFRGRADDQVKIRGFRIELGEIEGTVREYPGVSDCAAVALEVSLGDMRLVAYVVADSGGEDLRDGLMAHLAQRLPSYMVPSALSMLERIPLTRNGKIDRRALPAPSWVLQAPTDSLQAQTETEQIVAEVWQDILAIDLVGVEDNFFNLGGHSLLAARVVTQVRKRCEIEISVRALFEQPTLREFAAVLDAAKGAPAVAKESSQEPTPPHVDAGSSVAPTASAAAGAHPLSFPQQQLLFFDQLTPGSVTYNAALAWRVSGSLELGVLREALEEVFRRQEALRTVLVWGAEASPSQVVLEEWSIELALIELAQLGEREREHELTRLLREHALMPFDLAAELMLRTTLFRLAEQEHVILFAAHHVAFDAWAVEVLYRELGELYAAKLKRRKETLPALPLQYRDFAAWQREHLKGELLREELDFWRTHLAGAPTVTELPSDRPRQAAQSFAGATHHFALDSAITDGVRELCAATGVTPYMLLLASFATLLYRAGGQDDILFGGPMANREQPGLEHLIGFFANTIVVRVRLGANPSFNELLARVRDSVLASYEHQQVPLELVVEAVRPERDPGVNPLFQVNFRVRVGDGPRLDLEGTETRQVAVDLGLARFDLALELHMLEDRIEAELNYNVALFDGPSVERLAGDLEAMLRTLTGAPETRLLGVQIASQHLSAKASAPSAGAGIRSFRRGSGSQL
ncbi:MAG: amino acid adenylation domain-containing protein [Solirubrobacterales bacterium]|nr:amino acid adenylation domain-containing protein [Solirubrobacterales bacterium]